MTVPNSSGLPFTRIATSGIFFFEQTPRSASASSFYAPDSARFAASGTPARLLQRVADREEHDIRPGRDFARGLDRLLRLIEHVAALVEQHGRSLALRNLPDSLEHRRHAERRLLVELLRRRVREECPVAELCAH